MDRHSAVERRAPDRGSVLERVEALLADRRPRVSADGCNHSRIIEAFPGAIDVDDHDVRPPGQGRHRRNENETREGQKGEGDAFLRRLHGYFSSAEAFGATGAVIAFNVSEAGTQRNAGFPSDPTRTTTSWRESSSRTMVKAPSSETMTSRTDSVWRCRVLRMACASSASSSGVPGRSSPVC